MGVLAISTLMNSFYTDCWFEARMEGNSQVLSLLSYGWVWHTVLSLERERLQIYEAVGSGVKNTAFYVKIFL